jgi:hypothetical protein
VNRHVYTCVVGESIVPSQESEQTCVYMCGRGINCTETRKWTDMCIHVWYWFPYHTCIHMSVHFPGSVQLISLPYMYTHVCSLSSLGTIDSPTIHVYTCLFTFLTRYNWYPYHTCVHMSVHFPGSVQLIPLPHMYTHVRSLSLFGTIDTPTVNRHVYTCMVGESIVPSQESERTCVYMCGRGINCTEQGKWTDMCIHVW